MQKIYKIQVCIKSVVKISLDLRHYRFELRGHIFEFVFGSLQNSLFSR